MTHQQHLDHIIEQGREYDAWAQSHGWRDAAEYEAASAEAFAEWARYQA